MALLGVLAVTASALVVQKQTRTVRGASTERTTTSEDPSPLAAFNGGKMNHIFEFGEGFLYSGVFSCPEAKVALECGTIFFKIDGSNGIIIAGDDGTLHPYERLDTKGKEIPPHCTALPEGSNSDAYKGHSYCYEPVSLGVEGKKLKKRNQAMLDVVERHKDRLLSFGNTISIEWCGKKFQKTPGVPHDVAIAVHADQVCEEDFDRTQDGVRDFLLNSDPPIEGLIVQHKGEYWKVRSDW